MLSPCSHVSRPQRASTVAVAAAQWPQQLHHPLHTAPMPPLAALWHPAGQLQPHPLGAHSTTSHSRPCGLQHPLLQLQTGHPWPLNKLLQNLGLTLPWRQRDKGGPSPLPGPRGAGERMSPWAPFTPLSTPLCPGGERWTLARQGYILCQTCTAARMQVHGAKACSPQLSQIWLRVAWVPGEQYLGDQTAFPRRLTRPALVQGHCGQSPSRDMAGY